MYFLTSAIYFGLYSIFTQRQADIHDPTDRHLKHRLANAFVKWGSDLKSEVFQEGGFRTQKCLIFHDYAVQTERFL